MQVLGLERISNPDAEDAEGFSQPHPSVIFVPETRAVHRALGSAVPPPGVQQQVKQRSSSRGTDEQAEMTVHRGASTERRSAKGALVPYL